MHLGQVTTWWLSPRPDPPPRPESASAHAPTGLRLLDAHRRVLLREHLETAAHQGDQRGRRQWRLGKHHGRRRFGCWSKPLRRVRSAAALLGGGIFAGLSGYTSTSTAVYPVLARAKGYGAMMGIGRAGAILSPILAGYALSAMTPRAMYFRSSCSSCSRPSWQSPSCASPAPSKPTHLTWMPAPSQLQSRRPRPGGGPSLQPDPASRNGDCRRHVYVGQARSRDRHRARPHTDAPAPTHALASGSLGPPWDSAIHSPGISAECGSVPPSAARTAGSVCARQIAYLVLPTVRRREDLPQPLDEPALCHSEVHEDFLFGCTPEWDPHTGELDEALRLGVGMGACAVGFARSGATTLAKLSILTRVHGNSHI